MNLVKEGRHLARSVEWIERNPIETLSPRETEVLQLMVDGLLYRDIARTLGIAERTARSHANEVLSKLGVKSRAEASIMARLAGFICASEQPTTSKQAMAFAQRYLALAQRLAREGK